METLEKTDTPASLLLTVKKYYWGLLSKRAHHSFSKEDFEALPALKCQVAYNKYGGYCVPLASKHRPAAQEILSGGVYEPQTIEFLMTNSSGGDIIHAGTYFGDFLPALSRVCRRNCKIWAFEPNPENYKCAKITMLINDLGNVSIEQAGLGEKASTMALRTIDERGNALGGASTLESGRPTASCMKGASPVRIVAVDDFVPAHRRIKILQLDVEGHERQALAGSLETIRRWRPILVLEVWPESTLVESNWFSENILGLGYRNTDKIHGNYVFMCET